MLTVGEKFPQYRVQACVGTGKDDLTTIESDRFEGRWLLGTELHYPERPKDLTSMEQPPSWPAFDPKQARDVA